MVVAQFAPSGPLASGRVGQFVRRVHEFGSPNAYQKLEATNEWLGRDSSDALALRLKAEILLSIGRYEEAARTYDHAEAIFPFITSSTRHVVALMQAGRMKDARVHAERRARLVTPTAALAGCEEKRIMESALRDAGELGAARRILDEAVRSCPSTVHLLADLAQLDVDSDRAVEALPRLVEAVRLAPDSMWLRQRLVGAYRSLARYDDVATVLDRWRHDAPSLDNRYYWERAHLLGKQGKPSEAAALAKAARDTFPASVDFTQNASFYLREAGHSPEGLVNLLGLLRERTPTEWDVAELRRLTVDRSRSDSGHVADRILDSLRIVYPLAEALWRDASAHLTGPDSLTRRVAFWRNVVAKVPRRSWSWSNLTDRQVEAKDYSAAMASALEGVATTESASRGDQLSLLIYVGWSLDLLLKHQGADSLIVSTGLQMLEKYRDMGGHPALYHLYRRRALMAQGKDAEAAQEALKAARLRPDDMGTAFKLVADYIGVLPRGVVMQHVLHVVDRDPYNATNFQNLSKLQALYIGASISALRTQHLIEERFPRKRVETDAGRAWGDLGDKARYYTEAYSTATSVGNSDRYVKWFDDARNAAQHGSSHVVIDYATGVATITHPDGQIERRAEHPVSGKPTLLQMDAAWVRANYDSLGSDLLLVESSNGNKVRLTYDSMLRIDTMVVMPRSAKRATVAFEYNTSGKPTRISVTGVGAITIKYEADSVTIAKTESSAGRVPALVVTSSFQQLDDIVRAFDPKSARDQLPDLAFKDPIRDRLRAQTESASLQAHARAALTEARYLVAHISDRHAYAAQASELLKPLIGDGRSTNVIRSAASIEALSIWYDLLRSTRPLGLDQEGWAAWQRSSNWLDRVARGNSAIATTARQLLTRVNLKPLALLESARWYPHSYLNNPGFWRRYRIAELMPSSLREGAETRVVLVRRSHDVVVGSNAGLSVLRRGFWEWYAIDTQTGRFSATVAPERVGGASRVYALAEDSTGALWVGTADGALQIVGDYSSEPNARIGQQNGLPTPRVTHIVTVAGGVLLGTSAGVRWFDGAALRQVPGILDQEVVILAGAPAASFEAKTDKPSMNSPLRQPLPALIGTSRGLYAYLPGFQTASVITTGTVSHAAWEIAGSRIMMELQRKLYTVEWSGRGAAGGPMPLRGQQDVVSSQRAFGFSQLPIAKATPAIAVLTDQGMSIWHDNHFEQVDVPQLLGTKRAAVFAVSSRDDRTVLLTSEGVYAIERGQATVDTGGRVHDVLVANDLGLTFVARGDRLDVIRQDSVTSGPSQFDGISATRLARDREGRLISNDGTQIVRYARGEASAQDLFSARSSDVGNLTTRNIGNILVASDGAIWVAAGSSLFRWVEGDSIPQEFSYFLDPLRFPARSEMVSRVLETKDNRIWVIASNERHLQFKGQALEGGVLEWTGSGFRRLDEMQHRYPKGFFFSSYTSIDSNSAIIGTANGFMRQRGTDIAALRDDLKDASYLALERLVPALYLGTAGARLGKDMWLFGTAGGVVAQQAGHWFYPDRLNWMLPSDHLSQYGSRAVHAIAIDTLGHIYVGTDRGLLTYESSGDATSFLLSLGAERDAAFTAAEVEKLRAESGILLPSVDSSTALGRQIDQVLRSRAELAQLTSSVAAGLSLDAVSTPPIESTRAPISALPPSSEFGSNPQHRQSSSDAGKIRAVIAAKERAHRTLLAQLERDNLSLYQLLELKPLDLAALRSKLGPEDVIVQYLPTEKRLYIQIVTRDGIEVRENEVRSDTLTSRALALARQLGSRDMRGADLTSASAKPSSAGGVTLPVPSRALTVGVVVASEARASVHENLIWLYRALLGPVERDLASFAHVFIVPVGALSYVPFAALKRGEGTKSEHAVERFAFGYLPSMYLFDLMLRHKTSVSQSSLVLGDPDGTLKGARDEATLVNRLLGNHKVALLGAEVTLANITQSAGEARVLHFATHGFLNAERPENSYLLLADNRRLGIVDAMMLPLASTDLVVLSACETGLGPQGMEFATLARAFAHAGAPATVATLWRVDDAASSKLIELFYTGLKRGEDAFVALAKAQRSMLIGDEAFRAPQMWAGYVPFGKPVQLAPAP